MLAGVRAFRGETDVDTMTAVLREQPVNAKLLEAAIPTGYQDVVTHCLEKDPDNRFQSAKEWGVAFQTLSGSSRVRKVVFPEPKLRTTTVLPWAIVALLAVATGFLGILQLLRIASHPASYKRLTFEAGTVYSARFAPNGQSIVYSAAWNGRPVQLYSTVGNSLLAQPLELSDTNLLGISATNELAVLLGGTHNGQLETVGGMLAVAPLAGGSRREMLPDVRWAEWDSAGKLAVVHYFNGHSRLEYPIGNVLYQSGAWISNIRLSAKGDRIAFMDHPALWDNRGAVCMVDLAGHVTVLTREWESESGLAWSPDGKEIWFTAVEKGNNLNLMEVDLSGKVRTLLDLPMGVVLQDIAADGRVLITLKSQRLAMSFSASDNQTDVDLSSHDLNSARDISREGQFVLFEDASEAAGPGYAVLVRKVDGTLPKRLGEGSAGGLSPDGKWAASISTRQASQITLLPTGAGQPRTINVSGLDHIHNGWARFLPDGQRLSVYGDEAGHATRCYIVDIDSGKAKAVTPDGVLCGPHSPDSRSIVGKKQDGSVAIYPLQGSGERTIPNLYPTFNPVQWSDDGLLLYGYHMGEFPSRVYQVDIATGKETVIRELHPGPPAGVVMGAPVVVSGDGRHFAYSYNQTLSVLYLVSGLR